MFAAFVSPAVAQLGAIVVIEKHPTGADLIELTMVDPEAREQDLKSRVATISDGRRGTQLMRDPIRGSLDRPVLKATFAVDGWLKPDGQVRLAPIVQALCAPGPGRVQELRVVLSNFRPGADVLMSYDSGDLTVRGARMPDGYEYRIVSREGHALPPDRTPAPAIPTPPPASPEPGTPVWPVLAVTAMAAGALVYSAILYRRRSVRIGRPAGKSS